MWQFIGLATLVTTTLINIAGVRLLAVINNIGVAAEILGMLVFALILLFLANHQPVSVLFDTSYTSDLANGNYPAVFLVGMFMALFVVYGFDTAGTFGEETLDASRQAPRGILSAIWLSGFIGFVFLLAIILAIPDLQASFSDTAPIATSIRAGLGETYGNVYLYVILIAVYVCTLAIQGATTRLMFSMGRDRRLPLGNLWGHVSPTFRTPAYAAIAVGVIAAVPFFLTDSPGLLATGATGLIYLSYFMANVGVLAARRRGWPHKRAWFNLGSWGTIINILALIYGGVMVINFGLWKSSIFGSFGSDLRDFTNPSLNIITSGGNAISWLPDIPFFEATVGLILIVGAIYYVATGQGRKVDSVEADLATGEAVIA
jgi:amino acid transporter